MKTKFINTPQRDRTELRKIALAHLQARIENIERMLETEIPIEGAKFDVSRINEGFIIYKFLPGIFSEQIIFESSPRFSSMITFIYEDLGRKLILDISKEQWANDLHDFLMVEISHKISIDRVGAN